MTLYIRESSRASSGLETGALLLRLAWETNFRPEELQEDDLRGISSLDGTAGASV